MNNIDDFISIEAAANSTGITSRTIRYWISNGKLSCTSGKRGRLVRLSDIEQIKEITGRNSGNTDHRHPETTSAGNAAGNPPGSVSTTSVIGPNGLSLDLMHIRDHLLAPLLDQYAILDQEKTVLATEVGELRSDLRHERERREQAEGEREVFRQKAQELEGRLAGRPQSWWRNFFFGPPTMPERSP